MTELELYVAACAIDEPEKRDSWLEEQCRGNPVLRDRIRELLSKQRTPDSQLDTTKSIAAQSSRGDDSPLHINGIVITGPAMPETAGALIASKYQLVKQIGEGGMGSVWLAEQTEPVKRQVAVKLIRAERGMSQAILSRFEAERQAIALMDHPHIARLLDAGTTAAGAPFFVMELVKGVPFTEFCDVQQLKIADRLKLFQQVCAAVQHAHQKGIIHRDLKPSNILVETHDGLANPKVIDFGLAKATSGISLTDQAHSTGFGSVLGTPLYMAPEQTSFQAIDIDTRADVYALGVILYELLTGTTPITREQLQQAEWDDLLKLIREQEPPAPSQRLRSSQLQTIVAENRQIEPAKLTRLLLGELDWIVQKAISKERELRYESASALSKDLERFLQHEPVIAGPPTAGYRLRKFVQRNRGKVLAASLVLVALLIGIIGTASQAVRAEFALGRETTQRKLAETREQEAKVAKQKADDAADRERLAKEAEEKKRLEAETNLGYAQQGIKILSSIFKKLDPRKDLETVGEFRKSLQDNLQQAITELDGAAIGDPLVVADMQVKLGLALHGLADAKRSLAVLKQAHATQVAKLGENHKDSLRTADLIAGAHWLAGDNRAAISLFEKTLAAQEALLGEDHLDTIFTRNNLAAAYTDSGNHAQAIVLFEKNLRISETQHGRTDLQTASCMGQLAVVYQHAGRVKESIALLEEALPITEKAFGSNSFQAQYATNNLAISYLAAGRAEQALPMMEKALGVCKELVGVEHRTTLNLMNNLAGTYAGLGLYAVAIPRFKETLELQRRVLGPNHPHTLHTAGNLGNTYRLSGKPDLALPLLLETQAAAEKNLGPDHLTTLNSKNYLGELYITTGQLDLAVPLLEKVLQGFQNKYGNDNPDTALAMISLSSAYMAAKQPERAIPLLQQALKYHEEHAGAGHMSTITALNNLSQAYGRAGQYDRAIEMAQETLQRLRTNFGVKHPNYSTSLRGLYVMYRDSGKLELAVPTLEELVQLATAKFGPRHGTTFDWSWELAKAQCAAGDTENGTALFRRILPPIRALYPKSDPRFAKLLFGGAEYLVTSKQYPLAEEMLRESLEIRALKEPEAWTTFQTQLILGEALAGQQEFADAEPLLTKGYEALQANKSKFTAGEINYLTAALDRVIELLRAGEQTEAVKKWEAERAKLPPAQSASENKPPVTGEAKPGSLLDE